MFVGTLRKTAGGAYWSWPIGLVAVKLELIKQDGLLACVFIESWGARPGTGGLMCSWGVSGPWLWISNTDLLVLRKFSGLVLFISKPAGGVWY